LLNNHAAGAGEVLAHGTFRADTVFDAGNGSRTLVLLLYGRPIADVVRRDGADDQDGAKESDLLLRASQ
jgi:hypothetical protein